MMRPREEGIAVVDAPLHIGRCAGMAHADVQLPGKAAHIALVREDAGQQPLRLRDILAVLASLIGGSMFDAVGVRSTMLTAVAIAVVGTVISLAGTREKRPPS